MVLVDEVHADGTVIARSAAEAPEIDGVIRVAGVDPESVDIGDFIEVAITDTDEHDLIAELPDD